MKDRMNRMKNIAFLVGFLLLSGTTVVRAAEYERNEISGTHGEVLDELIRECSDSLLAGIPWSEVKAPAGVVLKIEASEPFDRALEGAVIDGLIEGHALIFDEEEVSGNSGQDGDETGDNNVTREPQRILKVGLDAVSVTFPSWHRKWLVGPTLVDVHYKVELEARLIDGNGGRIIWTSRAESVLNRNIPLKKLERFPNDFAGDKVFPDEVSSPMETIVVLLLVLTMAWILSGNSA
jgi:hypothetical protein